MSVEKKVVMRLTWGALVTEAGYVIGRHAHESLQGMPKSMSRYHVKVRPAKDGGVFVQDNKSLNGTQVATRQVAQQDDVSVTLDLPEGGSILEAAVEEAGVPEVLGCSPELCNGRVVFTDRVEAELVRLENTEGKEVRIDPRCQYLVLGSAADEADLGKVGLLICIRFVPAGESETEVRYVLIIERCKVQTYTPPTSGEEAGAQ